MTEEFSFVTRKKWMTRKSIQKKPRRISDRGYDADCPEVDIDKFEKRLQQLCTQMSNSEYFSSAMTTLDEGIHTLKLAHKNKLDRLVCLGIGPFTRNFQAFHQLAFILSTQRHYNITEAIYFDPVFRDSEKEILKRLNCSLMTENCEAKHEASVPTLYYLPHCPNCLTNNLLWCNWRPQNLKNVILINNSFESLSTSKPERFLRLDSGFILNVLPHVKELSLDDDYETQNIFNDLSVHIFPNELLPDAEANFWEQLPAPTYDDVEMISAEDFNKMSIN